MDFSSPYLLNSNAMRADAKFNIEQSENCCKISFMPQKSAKLKEVVLWSGKHGFAPNTLFYGDGYQKLTQYAGTIKKFKSITGFTDRSHYKMPQTDGFNTVYNYVLIGTGENTVLVGATSCNRFRTEFRINEEEMQIVQSLEDLEYKDSETVCLEEMIILKGEKNAILKTFSKKIQKNHPPKKYFEMPVGWCSWYCIGPNISEKKIFENLKVIKEKTPQLKYIQIDDGFQPFMGDWLETSDKFDRSMKEICNYIKNEGFEPAIWLAPFIASPKSRLLREHPDYFIQDENGKPLCSKDVTFSGWRDGPWYFLDGTNPNAQEFLYNTVHEIYKNWNVKYFKLDANVWGALPFGIRYDKTATATEAYRRGMEAIWHATENNAFILGCNAPMWASLGTVTGMRVTNDVVRNTQHICNLSEQCFHRNWMHKTLWINDPDCLIMTDTSSDIMDPAGAKHNSFLKKIFYKLNNIYVRASGGIVLSGDYVSKYSTEHISRLQRLLNTDYNAAEFDDNSEVGVLKKSDAKEYFIFNRKSHFKKYEIVIPDGFKATDMYDNKPLNAENGTVVIYLTKFGSAWIKISKND